MLSGFWPPSPTSSTFGYPFPIAVNVVCKCHIVSVDLLTNIFKCEPFMIFIINQMYKIPMTFFYPKFIWIFKIQKIPEIISLQNVLCCVKALACSQKSVVQVHWHCPTSQFWHWNVNHLSLYRQLSRFYQWKGRSVRLIFLTARILMIQIMQVTFLLLFLEKSCVYTAY